MPHIENNFYTFGLPEVKSMNKFQNSFLQRDFLIKSNVIIANFPLCVIGESYLGIMGEKVIILSNIKITEHRQL
jgi:hypothetical protein